MANTTSGTATFDKTFAIDEIVEESFERIGLQERSWLPIKISEKISQYLVSRMGKQRYSLLGNR